ncbi:MAG: hypothetical protein RR540_00505 [Oscillospiraceae bacterium]
MNIVLVSSKKFRKDYEPILQKAENTILLGCEICIKNGFVNKIIEDYNPHTLIIANGVQIKDEIDLKDMISLLRLKRPTLRIIYIYGEIKDINSFNGLETFLLQNEIFDIFSGVITAEKMLNLISMPLTLEAYQESKIDKSAEKIVIEEAIIEEKVKVIDKSQVEMDKQSQLLTEFDIAEITTINQDIEEIVEIKNITIGLTELLHHSGCTHISFEIASFLSDRKKSVCIVICDGKTYNSLANFYEIDLDLAKAGFAIKNISIYPFAKLDEVKKQYNYIICDFGYPRSEQQEAFADCIVKMMLCSSAEWDITTLMNYINLSQHDYVKEINYCFYPISQPKFLAYNKRLIKGNCSAYRLQTSNDWCSPCLENCEVFLDILKKYTDIIPLKRRKRIKTQKKREKKC